MLGTAKHREAKANPYWQVFDVSNHTGGNFSNISVPAHVGQDFALAVTLSDRYFLRKKNIDGSALLLDFAQPGDYVEIQWNSTGGSNHAFGLGTMNGAGPQWVSPGFASMSYSGTGLEATGTQKIIGMQRTETQLIIRVDNVVRATIAISNPAQAWYWAMSATSPAQYKVLQVDAFVYPENFGA